MDPIKNPYCPNAGAPPPELVGRDSIIAEARILLGRVKQKRSEKSMLLTGLRGVGKTVLLNEIKKIANKEGYQIISFEANDTTSLGVSLASHLRTLLLQLDRLAGFGEKVKLGMRLLRGFISSLTFKIGDVSLSMDVEPERGADSGNLEIDLPNLFSSIGDAAEDRKTAVAIFIDEIHYYDEQELGALIMAMHKMQQNQLPLVLVGAGLPIVSRLVGNAKSYSERLFNLPKIDALSEEDTAKALQDPANTIGVRFEETALKEIYRLTKGYPYFVQTWGSQAWNLAVTSPITLQVIKDATINAIATLDGGFFRVRLDRLTPGEKSFLRAMAEFAPGAKRTSDVAQALGREVKSITQTRANLLKKGMIFSPAHGDMEFTVPLFDEFMKRTIPEFNR